MENGTQVVKLGKCSPNDENEPPIACGRFTNTDGSQFDCAHQSLMERHGVTGEGCAGDLIDDETGKAVDVEICYCGTDGCNNNCICPSEKPDTDTDKPYLDEPSISDFTGLHVIGSLRLRHYTE